MQRRHRESERCATRSQTSSQQRREKCSQTQKHSKCSLTPSLMLRSSSLLKVVHALLTLWQSPTSFENKNKQTKKKRPQVFLCFGEALNVPGEVVTTGDDAREPRGWGLSYFHLQTESSIESQGMGGGGGHSPEASPGRPVLPMLDSKWSMLGAGCTSSVSTGVCRSNTTALFSPTPKTEPELLDPAAVMEQLLSDVPKIKAGVILFRFIGFIKQQNLCLEFLLLFCSYTHMLQLQGQTCRTCLGSLGLKQQGNTFV